MYWLICTNAGYVNFSWGIRFSINSRDKAVFGNPAIRVSNS